MPPSDGGCVPSLAGGSLVISSPVATAPMDMIMARHKIIAINLVIILVLLML